MSIITYYARLNQSQLDELRADSRGLGLVYERCPQGAEVIDLDKASGVIAWLLSPCKRAEQAHFAADMDEVINEIPTNHAALPVVPSLDDFAISIEGRGPSKEERLEHGLGPACHFDCAEVERFAQLLSSVDQNVLRRELDFQLMDNLFLPVEYWEEQGEQNFSEYILPLFKKLKQFYMNAANSSQHVLVWYA